MDKKWTFLSGFTQAPFTQCLHICVIKPKLPIKDTSRTTVILPNPNKHKPFFNRARLNTSVPLHTLKITPPLFLSSSPYMKYGYQFHINNLCQYSCPKASNFQTRLEFK